MTEEVASEIIVGLKQVPFRGATIWLCSAVRQRSEATTGAAKNSSRRGIGRKQRTGSGSWKQHMLCTEILQVAFMP